MNAAVSVGRKGVKSKSAKRKNGVLVRAKAGLPKKIVQDGVVLIDEGGGNYIPKEKKP